MKALSKPLSKRQLRLRQDENGYVTDVVRVDLDDVIVRDREGFLDLLSTRLTGDELLMDIEYNVVGHDGDTLFIRVSGNVSGILDNE